MKKILVPSDFSRPALEAFRFAIELAKLGKGSVTVVHAIDLPPMIYGGAADSPTYIYDPRLRAELKERAERNFTRMNARYGRGAKVRFMVREGSVFTVVRSVATAGRFDLVVAGTHGSAGLEEFLVGSNTEKIVRFSPVPVLALRKALPVRSIKNIVVPVSLERGQETFIKKLKVIQQFFRARLHLLYLNTPLNFVHDHELRDFARHHRLSRYTLNIRHHRYEPDGIVDFVREIKAQMLAMPTHARKGLAHLLYGSVTEKLVNRMTCPVWTYSLGKK